MHTHEGCSHHRPPAGLTLKGQPPRALLRTQSNWNPSHRWWEGEGVQLPAETARHATLPPGDPTARRHGGPCGLDTSRTQLLVGCTLSIDWESFTTISKAIHKIKNLPLDYSTNYICTYILSQQSHFWGFTLQQGTRYLCRLTC